MSARIAGVIGWPVGHSLSPRIHGYWLRSLKIDAAYAALPAPPEDFSRAIEGLRRAGFAGLNVTLPHKHAAFAIAETLDDAARATGAVNLLLFRHGRVEGRNTDVEGLRASLVEEFGADIVNGAIAVVLGAGGAARAAAVALDRLGAKEIRFANRNPGRARTLAADLQPHLKAALVAIPWTEGTSAIEDAVLLVNATSAGMQGGPALDVSLETLPSGAAVYDVVYTPLETGLVRRAKARGLRAATGLGMLLNQAAPSFAAFYGVAPSITPELRHALAQALSP